MQISSRSYGISIATNNEMPQFKALLLLSKPGIVSAEALAGFAAMAITTATFPSLGRAVYGIICIILAATGAAMANSVLEHKTDLRMARLTHRCRALEVIGRSKVAVIAFALMMLSFIIAVICVNTLTATLLVAAAASYLLLYTAWLKKSSSWGVIAGAIPGALPPLIGSAAVVGDISPPAFMIACLIFVWQLPHFWFLALHYLDEYRQAAIPVLPVTCGITFTHKMILTSLALVIPVSLTFYITGHSSVTYAFVALAAGIAFLIIGTINIFREQFNPKGHIASVVYLMIILGALILDSYAQA